MEPRGPLESVAPLPSATWALLVATQYEALTHRHWVSPLAKHPSLRVAAVNPEKKLAPPAEGLQQLR
jgi:hypothetical protein